MEGRLRLIGVLGNFDVLSRPRNETPEVNDEGLVQERSN
jgi:hypothetical protein